MRPWKVFLGNLVLIAALSPIGAKADVSSAIYEDAQQVIRDVVETEAAQSAARVVSCASPGGLLQFFPETLENIYQGHFDGLTAAARLEGGRLLGTAAAEATYASLADVPGSWAQLLMAGSGATKNEYFRCEDKFTNDRFTPRSFALSGSGASNAALESYRQCETAVSLGAERTLACEVGKAVEFFSLGSHERAKEHVVRLLVALIATDDLGDGELPQEEHTLAASWAQAIIDDPALLSLVRSPSVRAILTAQARVTVESTQIRFLDLLGLSIGVSSDAELALRIRQRFGEAASSEATCALKHSDAGSAEQCVELLAALRSLGAQGNFAQGVAAVVGSRTKENDAQLLGVVLEHMEFFEAIATQSRDLRGLIRGLTMLERRLSAFEQERTRARRMITKLVRRWNLGELSRFSSLVDSGDNSAALHDGLSLALESVPSALRKFLPLFEGLLPYILNGEDEPGPAVREKLRKALALALLETHGGYTNTRLLGFEPVTLSLKAAFSESHRASGESSLRTVASVDALTFRATTLSNRYTYTALQLSLLDLLGPFSEFALRSPRGAGGSTLRDYTNEDLVWLNFMAPRLDLFLASPAFSKRLGIFAGFGFRATTVNGNGAYLPIWDDGWKETNRHLEISAGVRFFPF